MIGSSPPIVFNPNLNKARGPRAIGISGWNLTLHPVGFTDAQQLQFHQILDGAQVLIPHKALGDAQRLQLSHCAEESQRLRASS